MIPLTCALITGTILSLFFANTRIFGIITIVVLTFLYPIQTVIAVLIVVGFYCHKKFFSK